MDSKAWQVGLPILEAILILVVGYFAIKLVLRGVKKLLERTKQVDSMLHTFILHAVEIFLWVVIILSALNKLGIDSTSVVTVLAACGAAVALALQGSLSNLAGGILIISVPAELRELLKALIFFIQQLLLQTEDLLQFQMVL